MIKNKNQDKNIIFTYSKTFNFVKKLKKKPRDGAKKLSRKTKKSFEEYKIREKAWDF